MSLSQKFLDNFPLILVEDVKLMLNKELKVSHQYLPLFLSYRENLGVVENLPLPRAHAKTHAAFRYLGGIVS